MSYTHFGQIGDICKHLPLADFLTIENPGTYIESNCASSIYKLSNSPEQNYGVYHFYYNCHKSQKLLNSKYYNILKYFNPDELFLYPGSPAIALNILNKSVSKFIFYDIEKESLENIQKYSEELNISSKCEYNNEDSIIGIIKTIDSFDKNTFIHFDPYEAFLTKSNGYTYFDLFLVASKRGIKCMLWYGFMTGIEKEQINEIIKTKILSKNVLKNITCIEIFLKLIQEDTVIINPGIIGSGILTGNLSKKSLEIFESYSEEIEKVYKNSILFDKYNGDLEIEKIII